MAGCNHGHPLGPRSRLARSPREPLESVDDGLAVTKPVQQVRGLLHLIAVETGLTNEQFDLIGAFVLGATIGFGGTAQIPNDRRDRPERSQMVAWLGISHASF